MRRYVLVLVLILGFVGVSKAADPSIHRQSYIERQRLVTTRLLDILNEVKELRVEYDSQGFSGAFTEQDFINSNNNQISPAEFGDLINSQQAITELLSANGNAHNGNLYRIVR